MAATLTRGPYLQLMTNNSVTVVWKTDTAAACALKIRPVGGALTTINGGTGTTCAIPVAGLTPGAQYAYTPLAGGAALSGEVGFHTGSNAPFSFQVVGDTGCGCPEQTAVRDRMLATPADFIVSTGDMIYDAGAAADFDPKFFDPYAALVDHLVFWPTLGNHDVQTSGGAPWRDAFMTPANNAASSENYYSFDYGNAHVAVIDSNASTSPGSAQYKFLDQDMSASTATWKFVAFHHTIYSTGAHGSASGIQSNLVPLFDRLGIDMVLMGHDHDYERTKPMFNNQVVGAGEGTIYVTTGGGGKDIRPMGKASFTAYGEAVNHITHISINGGTLVLQMIRVDGAIRDTLTLTKDGTPPAPPANCGDGVVQAGEECDNGTRNSDTAANACRTNCTRAFCGDSVVDTGEQCDPPNAAGCDAHCQTQAVGCTAGCDDGDFCTADRCATDHCAHAPVPDCCHTAADCNDGNGCTVDSCDTAHVCHHVSSTATGAALGRSVDGCGTLPGAIAKSLARANTILGRAGRTKSARRAEGLGRAVGKLMSKAARAAARLAKSGKMNPECAVTLQAMAAAVSPACLANNLSPVADTYIEAGTEATWDHGASDHCDVDASPAGLTYLKFDLSTMPAAAQAILELYVTNASADGGKVYVVSSSSWVEGTGNGIDASSTSGPGLKWGDVDTNGDGKVDAADNSRLAPDPSKAVATVGRVARGQVLKLDVTRAFSGPGMYTLAVMSGNRDGTTFTSREGKSATRRPVLHLVTGGAGGAGGGGGGGPQPPPPPAAGACGDGQIQSPEQCDGANDDACPGLCLSDCRCSSPAQFSCLTQNGPLVTLSGTYNGRYQNSNLAVSTKLDARAGTFLAGPSNLYPINIDGGDGICFAGGNVQGQYDRNLGWQAMHDINNAGFRFQNANLTVDGIRIDNVEDGIRPVTGPFTVQNAWLSYIRDDCVENDHVAGGLVSDSLFDGCYVGISERPSPGIAADGFNGANATLTVRSTLIRLQPMPGPRGGTGLGHGQFFKWSDLATGLVLENNIFMAEEEGQGGASTMGIPSSMKSCANNVMVWLGPGNYPTTLPSCFTVTKDRGVWDRAVADWKARHPQVGR